MGTKHCVVTLVTEASAAWSSPQPRKSASPSPTHPSTSPPKTSRSPPVRGRVLPTASTSTWKLLERGRGDSRLVEYFSHTTPNGRSVGGNSQLLEHFSQRSTSVEEVKLSPPKLSTVGRRRKAGRNSSREFKSSSRDLCWGWCAA